MSEKKFTLIELHLDGDHQFGPRAIGEALPFGEKHEEADDLEAEADDEEDELAAAEEEESNGRSAVGAVVALVVLVGIAVAVKKYRGGDEEDPLEQDEQPDVVVN